MVALLAMSLFVLGACQRKIIVLLDYNDATGGNEVQSISVTAGEPIGTLPEPAKDGHVFMGWYLGGELVTIETVLSSESEVAMLVAKWQVLNTVTFVADDTIISTQTYTAANKTVNEPTVPEKSGYTGRWEDYSLTNGVVVVNAIYTPIEYTVTFATEDATVDTRKYTVENKDITEPTVPEVVGYSGTWEDYTLTTGDVTVYAVYDPIEYTVTFKADNVVVETQKYTVENKNVTAPVVPAKIGYTGIWQQYTLNYGDKTVRAEYTLIGYSVTFVADDKLVASQMYTVENKNVVAPVVPDKYGYKGEWEYYELTYGDKIVHAVYTPLNKVKVYFSNPISGGRISKGYIDSGDDTLHDVTSGVTPIDHKAIDLRAEEDANVVSMYDGVVINVEKINGMGNVVVVDHGENVVATYASLSEVAVEKGQMVKKGNILGTVGTTASYEAEDGPHLHLVVKENGKLVDPTPYVNGTIYREVIQDETN